MRQLPLHSHEIRLPYSKSVPTSRSVFESSESCISVPFPEFEDHRWGTATNNQQPGVPMVAVAMNVVDTGHRDPALVPSLLHTTKTKLS